MRYGIHHKAKPWVVGMAALRTIAWYHSSHGIILDESLSAHIKDIKDPAPVEQATTAGQAKGAQL